ncbi:MAG: nucleoside triphosphate pyrophosphohydrolase [Proteobacteria bacterium]|nr:nucleoside triphosphate pyrophosphohydrolase [Pseudomonadota bacterium]
MRPSRDVSHLLNVMAALRDRQAGCPWDVEQDFASIAPYTIEEAHEVADAIARGDMVDLCEELGDLLLQVVFHAQMGAEAGFFEFGDVVEAITSKLIRRHPHVFGDGQAANPAEVGEVWARIKAEEKAEKLRKKVEMGIPAPSPSLLDGVPPSLPALTKALKLQQKASKVGFDWNDPRAVLAKFREEIQELEDAFDKKDASAMKDEMGDMLFVIANLARHADIDPESALEGTNAKFRRRFGHIEARARAEGRSLDDMSLEEMDALWDEAKALEKGC